MKKVKKDVIFLTTLATRLERAIHADVGMKGLKILIYGWNKKYHLIDDYTFYNRAKDNRANEDDNEDDNEGEEACGEAWLTLSETMSLSHYAGYDLTHD